jgi:hypothetical protein
VKHALIAFVINPLVHIYQKETITAKNRRFRSCPHWNALYKYRHIVINYITSWKTSPKSKILEHFNSSEIFQRTLSFVVSLNDLEGIGKGDLVSDLFDVNDINLGALDDSNTVPLTHASDPLFPPSEISPNPPMSQSHVWMPRDQEMPAQFPRGQRQVVSSAGMVTSTYDAPRVPPTGTMPPPGVGTTGIVSPQGVPRGVVTSPQRVSPGVPPGMSQGVPPGMVPPRSMPQNGIPVSSHQFVNGDLSGYNATMTSSQTMAPRGNMGPSQAGLLQVQTQPMQNRSYIKTEPTQYYCNSVSMDSGMPGGMGNGPSFPGVAMRGNQYRYQNKLNHVGQPQWTTAPPSPYSSGSSSTSSYDALHVQFSPTDMLTSPFASPRDDSDYNHGNAQSSVPLPGQLYTTAGYKQQRSFARPPPSFPQPFVDIPEIAPMGVVEELVPGMHRTSPIAARTTAGLTHFWGRGCWRDCKHMTHVWVSPESEAVVMSSTILRASPNLIDGTLLSWQFITFRSMQTSFYLEFQSKRMKSFLVIHERENAGNGGE